MLTHETYFRTYNLSVEQYGEILATQAFPSGRKMASGNRGYDVKACIDGKEARIEVKSKLSTTQTGKATVVHCGKHKFGAKGMTHLLVVLVDPSHPSSIDIAWLLTARQAKDLRRRRTKSQYINVDDLRKAHGIEDVTKLLQRTANASLRLNPKA